MLKIFLLIFLSILSLPANSLLVIANNNFPENNLSKQEVKAIFLDKKRFIHSKKILAMNHKTQDPLRLCFEKNILEKSERSLERYWRKAFYQGKKPPKIISSVSMLFLYLNKVKPSIGYVDGNHSLNKDIKVLYKVDCL